MERFRLAKLLLPLYPIACVVLAASLAASLSSCDESELSPVTPPMDRAQLREVPGGSVPRIRVRFFARNVDHVELSSTGGAKLSAGPTVLLARRDDMSPVTLRRGPAGWHVGSRTVQAMALTFEATDGYVRVRRLRGDLAWRTYRGRLHLLPVGSNRLMVVNEVGLESYLLGVLAEEMYGSWHIEAFRAQAIAARTHAWHRALSRSGEDYDVNDDVSSQMYAGIGAETPKARQAVLDTWGRVLTYPLDGRPHLFMAQYSSSCGGRVNGAGVIRQAQDIPPLAGGQICTDCNQPGNGRYRWSDVVISKNRIFFALLLHDRAYYDPLGALEGVSVLRRTGYGRAVWLRLTGRTGRTRTIRAEDLRLIMLRHLTEAKELYSMNCRILDEGSTVRFSDGRGWGHGVGMCQWGAQGKALKGHTAEEILGFYYRGARIHQAYASPR